MITKLHVKNFKCLYDVTIDLAPFTVLIGMNDSGKKSLIEAIRLLGRTTKEAIPQVFSGANIVSNLLSRKNVAKSLFWEVEGKAEEIAFRYVLEIDSKTAISHDELYLGKTLVCGSVPEKPANIVKIFDQEMQRQSQTSSLLLLRGLIAPEPGRRVPQKTIDPTRAGEAQQLIATADALSSTGKYSLDPEKLRQDAAPTTDNVLNESGSNLTAVIDDILTGPDRSTRSALEDALNRAIPDLRGVSTRSLAQNGAKSLEFALAGPERPPVTIPAASASDGAMLISAFLALSYSDTPEIVFIEEPENGLHYSRLGMVIDLLRKMTTGEVGNRPRQVIVTTHSPLLLGHVKPEEVRVLTRDGSGGTRITAMQEAPNIKNFLKEFDPGELWVMLGEESLIKGASQ